MPPLNGVSAELLLSRVIKSNILISFQTANQFDD